MRILRFQLLKGLLAPVIALGLAAGCQTYNPATGQQQIDYGATAGVAGAAMGAAALGVALSNNNNNDRYYSGGRPVYYGGGGRGHNDVNVNRNVNVSGNTVNRNSNNNASRNVNRGANRGNYNAGGHRGGGGYRHR